MAQRSILRFVPLLQPQLGLWQLGRQPLRAISSQNTSDTPASPDSTGAHTSGGLRGVSGDVPAGHLRSDLSSAACHIGLNRRRDLTLRRDLCLWQGSSRLSLEDVFKGKRLLIVGFPGGAVCTEKHIPGYHKAAAELTKRDMDGVVLVTVAPEGQEPQNVPQPPANCKVTLLTDRNAGFMKLLGLDLAPPETAGKPRCQRFAGIVDDGILLKLKVEKTPANMEVSDAQSMIKLLDDVYACTKSSL